MATDSYIEDLKKRYPEDRIWREIAKIEKLGYEVWPSENQCQIYDSSGKMIIDADFRNTMYENLIDAIYGFWSSDKL